MLGRMLNFMLLPLYTGVFKVTTTERDGTFALNSVPAGSYTVTATYPGLDPLSVQVEVKTGATASATFSLSQGVIQMDRLVVRGSKEGMSQAVALQKISIQSKLVAAADQFGTVSEGNIGEYLKFLPGVTIDYNVNDARGVSLRGLSTAFTIVAVDGTPMAGASSIDDTRRFEFEQIAMNNVETTELFKTVTPDIAATSSGGFVNFITKSAFDHQDVQRFDYDVSLSAPSTNLSLSKEGGVWGHNTHYLVRPSVELNYSRKLTDKLGININYRLSEKYDDSPRTEFTWLTSNAANVTPNIFTNPRLQSYGVRSEEKLTHRQAFATKVDYILSDSTKLMFSGQWNWYDLNFTQRGPVYGFGTAATLPLPSQSNTLYPSQIPLGTTYTSGAGASITAGTLYRNKYGTTMHYNGRLTHEFSNDSKLEITPYYSRADGHYRDTTKGFISSTATMAVSATAPISSFTLTNPQISGSLPTIIYYKGTAVADPSIARDLSNYSIAANNGTSTSIQSRPWTALDVKDGVRADYTYVIDRLKLPVTIMTGYELDKTKRTIDRPDYRPVTTAATTGAALVALADPLYTRDVALGFGSFPALDPYKVYDAFKSMPFNLNVLDHRVFNETNNAAYVRADVKLTTNFLLLGGVRWEKRTIDATGITGAPARARSATTNINFDSYYPSISFKYTPQREIVMRGGFSKTIGIPDYVDMLPILTVPSTATSTDGTISLPAPNLKPYSINNYDLSLDYYLKNSGVLTMSVFRKDISDYIITRSLSTAEETALLTSYGLNVADFGVTPPTTRENGPKTRLQGVELSYAQNLTFLPKPFDSLNVQANYTITDISAFSPDASLANDAQLAQSRGVSPRSANLILGWRYKKFSTTITTNWVSASEFGGFVGTSAVIGTAGTATLADTRLALFRDEKTTTDIKVEYAFSKRFSAYFLVRNVFNSPRKDYARGYTPQNGTFTVPYRYYEFGEPHLTIGFKGRF